jgi:hypothetical protein
MAAAGEGLGWAADHQAIGRDRHILGTSRHDRQVRIIGRKARREVPAEGAGAEDADFEGDGQNCAPLRQDFHRRPRQCLHAQPDVRLIRRMARIMQSGGAALGTRADAKLEARHHLAH